MKLVIFSNNRKIVNVCFLKDGRPPRSTLLPYTTLVRTHSNRSAHAYPYYRPVQQRIWPVAWTGACGDWRYPRARGMGAAQQPRIRATERNSHCPARAHTRRPTHAGWSGWTTDKGLEKTGLFPFPPQSHSGLWARGHAPWRATADH